MRRREFVAGLSVAAVMPRAARAQPKAKKIGVLQGLAASDPAWQPRLAAFRQGLAELGWIEGRNFVFEFRYADAKPESLPRLAEELVQAKVDIIVVASTPGAVAAKATIKTIPVIFVGAGDPVGVGIVASLGRPGGNLTGFSQAE